MIFDLNRPETVLEHFNGGEGCLNARMHSDDNGRFLLGRLEPGSTVGLHKHTSNYEVIYILSGTGKAIYDDTTEELGPGSCHYCPAGHTHSLINSGTEDLIFFAVVPNAVCPAE